MWLASPTGSHWWGLSSGLYSPLWKDLTVIKDHYFVHSAFSIRLGPSAPHSTAPVILAPMLGSKDLKVRLAQSIEWWQLNC